MRKTYFSSRNRSPRGLKVGKCLDGMRQISPNPLVEAKALSDGQTQTEHLGLHLFTMNHVLYHV